jgi:uncharacterized protein
MQSLRLAYDAGDEMAGERRAAARPAHLSLISKMKDAGDMHIAAAIQDEQGIVIGSVLICELSSRVEVDSWLKEEPYVTSQVWDRIEVHPCVVGAFFLQSGTAESR